MATLLLIIQILFMMPSSQASFDWEKEIRNKYGKDFRIAFGQSDLSQSEADSIETANKKALFELTKTFRVQVSGSTVHESSASTLRDGNSSRQNSNSNILNETVERIGLVGVDLSNHYIDRERNVVTTAAIIKLKDFDAYLKQESSSVLEGIKKASKGVSCRSVKDLKSLREISSQISKFNEYSLLLSSIEPGVQIDKSYSVLASKIIKDCRQSFAFIFEGNDISLASRFADILLKEGFTFYRSEKGLKASKNVYFLGIKKQFSELSNIFSKVNITGHVEVELYNMTHERFTWKSNTLRSSDLSAEIVQSKLGIRLNDETVKGLRELLELHF